MKYAFQRLAHLSPIRLPLRKHFHSKLRILKDVRGHEFFDQDFEENKDNMLTVAKKFDSLNIKEKLLVKSHFIKGLLAGKRTYLDSRALKWLLSDKNIASLINRSLDRPEDLEIKQLSDIMIISGNLENEHNIQKIIKRLKELLPMVQDSHDLHMTLQVVFRIMSLPSHRWSTAEKILCYHELTNLEKITRKYRTVQQEVMLFNLLKEFDLAQITEVEHQLLANLIPDVAKVKPSLFLKLLHNLMSHALFELNAKGIHCQMDGASQYEKEELLHLVPSLEYLDQIAHTDYFPEIFSSIELKETLPHLNALRAFEHTLLMEAFPAIGEHLSRITSAKINKNFSDRRVINWLFKMTQNENNLRIEYTQFFFDRFANTLANYASVNLELREVFLRFGINVFRAEISRKIFQFTNDFSISLSFFRKIANSFATNPKNSDTRKLGMFIESCFFFVFPICFYCFKFKQCNPKTPVVEEFFHLSVDFLLYICNISRSTIRKIKEFDQAQKVEQVKRQFGENPERMQQHLIRLGQIQESNQLVLRLIREALVFSQMYYQDLDLDPKTLVLKRNVRSLLSLLK